MFVWGLWLETGALAEVALQPQLPCSALCTDGTLSTEQMGALADGHLECVRFPLLVLH